MIMFLIVSSFILQKQQMFIKEKEGGMLANNINITINNIWVWATVTIKQLHQMVFI